MLKFLKNIAKEKALVLRFVKEAKEMQKSSSIKNITLEQCKRDIARRYGYPSWTHLEDNISCKKPAVVDRAYKMVTTNIANPEPGLMYLGYDVLLSNYRWLQTKDFIHSFILGEDRYDNYDLHLAMQAIQQNQNVIFVNGKGDDETLQKLLSVAKDVGREKEIGVYSLKPTEASQEFGRSFSTVISDKNFLKEAVLGMIMFPEEFDPSFQKWYNFAQNMLETLLPLYTYQKQLKDVRNPNPTFSIKEYFEYLEVKNIRYVFNFLDSIPEDLQLILTNYLNSIPGFAEQNMDKVWETHTWITHMLRKVVVGMNESEMFNSSGDDVLKIREPYEGQEGYIKILNLNDDDDSMKNMASYWFFASLKTDTFQTLGLSHEYIEFKDSEFINTHKTTLVYVRESPYDIDSVNYAHFRAAGIKMCFSYKNEDSVNKYVLSPDNLLHNVSLTVVSLRQSDFYPDIANFPMQPHENSVLLKKDGITLQLYLPK